MCPCFLRPRPQHQFRQILRQSLCHFLISDIVGILREQARSREPLCFEQIDQAVRDLYDDWERMPDGALDMIQNILAAENLDALYDAYVQEEAAAGTALLTFDEKYPEVLKEDNLADILKHLMER